MRIRLLHIVLLLILLLPTGASAFALIYDINAGSNYSADTNGKKNTFSKLCGDNLIKPGKITGNVVRCSNAIINVGGDRIIKNFVKPFSTIAYYAIIIAILFHGIQMMYGVAKSQPTLMTTIKILVVLFFCSPDGYFFIKNIRNVLIGFPKNIASSLVANPGSTHDRYVEYPEGSGIMVRDTPMIANPAYNPSDPVCVTNPNANPCLAQIHDPSPSATATSEHDISLTGFILDIAGIKNLMCKPDGKTAIGTDCPNYRIEDFYDKFDESIMGIFGVKDSYRANPQKQSQMFMGGIVLAAGLFFTGGWGAGFAMQIFLLATATIFMIAQMALYFLVVAVAINVLIAMTPIALACMLFNTTKNITTKWFNYLIVYSIQPILIVAFLIIIVTVLEKTNKELNAQNLNLAGKVDFQLDNASGTSNNISIFNCLGSSSSSDIMKEQMTNIENYNLVKSVSKKQNIFNNLSVTGNATAANVNDESVQKCDIKAFAFQVKEPEYTTASDPNAYPIPCMEGEPHCEDVSGGVGSMYVKDPNTISPYFLRNITSINVATIILMVIMLSFLKQMPGMVARMVSAGGSTTAVEIATNPTDKYLPQGINYASKTLGLANRY